MFNACNKSEMDGLMNLHVLCCLNKCDVNKEYYDFIEFLLSP